MACFHPLIRYVKGIDPETGKEIAVVRPYSDAMVDRDHKPWFEFMTIPCGKCIGCRLEYSRQWANRLMLEKEYYPDEQCWFVTLTYDDDYVPRRPVSDPDTGVYLYDSYSLNKRDVQTFFKHLRKHFPLCKIRFYAAGEYGSKTIRPHYHAIIFGLTLTDLTVYRRTSLGDILYNSKSVEDCWSNFVGFRSDGSPYYDKIGHVVLAPVTWETCAYVARYVTKKMSGPLAQYFVLQNMELPFSLMSRRPGIGNQWFKDHPDCMDMKYINLRTKTKGLKFQPPKYYEDLYEVEQPVLAELRKKERADYFERTRQVLLRSIDKPYLLYLADKEADLKGRLKVLQRVQI